MPRPRGKSRKQWYLDHNLPYPSSWRPKKQPSLFWELLGEKKEWLGDLAREFASNPRIVFSFMSSTVDKINDIQAKQKKAIYRKEYDEDYFRLEENSMRQVHKIWCLEGDIKSTDKWLSMITIISLLTLGISVFCLVVILKQWII